MAHNLEIRNGEASMFYVGQPPWHELGTQLNKPATAAEAIKAAKLDWRVCKKPLFASDGVVNQTLDSTYAVVRSDRWGQPKCPVLGIVGETYTPLQNEDAFAFFDPIVGSKAAIYHTAGVLGDGERIWILAQLPTNIVVKGDDVAEKYLLLSNSHDGKSSVQVKFTPIRVVCQNTLTMALNRGPTIRVAHTKDMAARLEQARTMLGLIERRYTDIGSTFQRMCRVQVDHARLSQYLGKVFPDPQDKDDGVGRRRARHNRLLAEYLFDNGEGNKAPGVQGTLWAAYNGVTEFVDHRGKKQTDDRRLDAIWFGDGYLTKARAFQIATEMLNQLAV